MEVHHHPDLHHKKKKFKEFFLEFIMIFLAVTLGFIAENVRESISNHEKEKQYIESFINNLRDDTTSMQEAIDDNNKKIDSLKKLVKLSSADFSKIQTRISLYQSSMQIGVYATFKSNDATMMQLKTSGLQLIKKDHVADSIAAYDAKIKTVYEAEAIYTRSTDDALLATQNIYDYSITNDTAYFANGKIKNVLLPLYIDNAASLPRFFNKINFEMATAAAYINNIKDVLPFTKRLIAYLKKEYDIE